jgi:1-acyl-sn-glycerol-3-phosphate acyltransferase
VRKQGLEHIPDTGPAILAVNHVSFVDALIVGGCVRRPVRFVMYYRIFQIPVLNFIFRTARAIPIAGAREDAELYKQAFVDMQQALKDGDLLCIFPEGGITHDGEMQDFRPGILRVLESQPVPVIPVALQGLWGSLFSRKGGRAFFKLPRRLFARIGLVVGAPLPATEVTTDSLRARVESLRGERR